MRRVLEETLTAVETLLGNKEYQKALDELKQLDQSQLDSECLGYFYILLTQARVNLGVYNTAQIDKAIEIFRFSSDTEKFARAKSLKGYLLSLEGNFSEASEILNEAYVNFKLFFVFFIPVQIELEEDTTTGNYAESPGEDINSSRNSAGQ